MPAKRAEENLTEADLRRYKEPKREAGAKADPYRRERRSSSEVARDRERQQRYAEQSRRLKHGIKEELKRGIDFSDVLTAGGSGKIREDKEAEKVTEKVKWHDDPKGPHGGKGFAPGGGDSPDEAPVEGEGGGSGAGTEEGAKGRRITLEGTRPANIKEAADKTEDVLKRMNAQMRLLDKAIGEGELEELDEEGGDGEDEDEEPDGEEAEA